MEKKLDWKSFDEYTQEEKETILNHWFYYYGKSIITMKELELFNELVKNKTNMVWDIAVISYIDGYSSYGLLNAMRSNSLEEYFETIRKKKEDYYNFPPKKTYYFWKQNKLISEIVRTYNNPEPAVEMEFSQIVEQLLEIYGMEGNDLDNATLKDDVSANKCDGKPLFSQSNIENLLADCLAGAENSDGDIYVMGICCNGVFNSEKVGSRKSEIKQYIDSVLTDYEPRQVLTLCNDRNGVQWTNDLLVVDGLIQLGLAAGVLSYAMPREKMDKLEDFCVVKKVLKKENTDNGYQYFKK